MASNGTPQSTMYQMRGRNTNDYFRDRSQEQYNATNNGNPQMPMFNYSPNDLYNQYFYGANNTPSGGQRQELGRYSPPMLDHFSQNWHGGQGGYSYNLPNNFGPYLGAYGSGNTGASQAGVMGGGNNIPGFMPKAGGLYYQQQGGYGQSGYGQPQQPLQPQGGPMPYLPSDSGPGGQRQGPATLGGRAPRLDRIPQYGQSGMPQQDQMGPAMPNFSSIGGSKPLGPEMNQFDPLSQGTPWNGYNVLPAGFQFMPRVPGS